MWTYEQFETALKRGRKIAPRSGIGQLRQEIDTACALGAIMLGAGFDLDVGYTSKNDEKVRLFREKAGIFEDTITSITDVNDNHKDRTTRDQAVLNMIERVLENYK